MPGTDLTDFFTKMAFFTPVDTTIDDHGKGQMTVTQQMADHALSRVKALGLSASTVGAGVYQHNNWETFREENRRGRFGHTY